ncbi:MAG: YciI family protein [Thermoplasmata archaeon]
MYFLVLLRPGDARSDPRLDAQHEAFIDGLIRGNEILLGGNLSPRSGLPAAYLLACDSRKRAEDVARDDPYVREGVFHPRVLEWRLVAINPDAVDTKLVLRPEDVR